MYKEKLINNLHKIMRNDPVVNELMKATGLNFDSLESKLFDLYNQYFIDTATWGLDIWEKQLGIKIDYNRSLENRRSLIKAKLRGEGKVDSVKIKSVVDSWTNGNVDVELISGTIKITFNDVKGIPSELNIVKDTLEDIKPAHLRMLYEFTYTIWSEVKNLTWSQIKTGTWGQLKTRQIV